MSEKDDLKKLVRAIVFILAFVVSGMVGIGILSLVMGTAVSISGLAMGSAAKSISMVSEIASIFPKIFEKSAQEEAARKANEAAELAAEEERVRVEEEAKQMAEAAAQQAAEEAAKRAAEEAAELIMKELGDFALEESSDNATNEESELKAAAEKWIKSGKAAANTKNFTFKASGGEEGYSWKATSKVKIGDCPAKSVWQMGYEGCERWNNVPKNCNSVTPKVISDYKGESPGC